MKNSSWKNILETYRQSSDKSSGFLRLLKDFVAHVKNKYTKTFIDLVCNKLSQSETEYLPHTLRLIEPLEEADKLTYYVQLINALPKSEKGSAEVLALMLEKHLQEFVKRNIKKV